MAKTQTVTISLEEYKELLLKDKPSSTDHEMVERIFNEIQKHLRYSDSRYNSGHIGDEMEVDNSTEVIKEIMTMCRYIDFDRYMKMWNTVQTNERKRKEMAGMVEQMQKAKELRNEG